MSQKLRKTLSRGLQIPFRHPTTVLIAGPTSCGKTHFLLQLLANEAFQPAPQRIVCVYGEWQPAYDQLRKIGSSIRAETEFVRNPTPEAMAELYETFNPSVRNLLILDDQMTNSKIGNCDGGLTKLFAQGSHHRNLTVIYIVQNLFNQSREMRNVSLNSHYLLLFRNARDKTQVRTLGQQMYPTDPQFLLRAFEDATKKPHGYLLVDLHPSSEDSLRIRTDILGSTVIYQPVKPI
jgi:hypothetical protein